MKILAISLIATGLLISAQAVASDFGRPHGYATAVAGTHYGHTAYHNGVDREHRGHDGVDRYSQGCAVTEQNGWMAHQTADGSYTNIRAALLVGEVCDHNGVWNWDHRWVPVKVYGEASED